MNSYQPPGRQIISRRSLYGRQRELVPEISQQLWSHNLPVGVIGLTHGGAFATVDIMRLINPRFEPAWMDVHSYARKQRTEVVIEHCTREQQWFEGRVILFGDDVVDSAESTLKVTRQAYDWGASHVYTYANIDKSDIRPPEGRPTFAAFEVRAKDSSNPWALGEGMDNGDDETPRNTPGIWIVGDVVVYVRRPGGRWYKR